MKTPHRRHFLALITGALVAVPVAGAAQGINGQYRAEGRNPDGSAYSGTANLTEALGTVTIQWRVGNQSYEGIGSVNGRVITVDWGDTHPVVYVLMPDGELHGTWADGRALERLSR